MKIFTCIKKFSSQYFLILSLSTHAFAQEKNWLVCEGVKDCSLALNPCAGLTGVNSKYLAEYKQWSEVTPWSCPIYWKPGDPTVSRKDTKGASLSCEGFCQVRWVVDERPIDDKELLDLSTWKPYIKRDITRTPAKTQEKD